MICPWCNIAFTESWEWDDIGHDRDGSWAVRSVTCPECHRFTLELTQRRAGGISNHRVRPLGKARPLSPEIDTRFGELFHESVAVLPISAMASAALSRRLLQDLIREKAGITKRNLEDEIDELVESRALPSRLADDLHAIRQVGNFAAHPIKSTNTGEIVEVEPGEAEWLLDLLEGLFDFYFVQPEQARKRRAALNEKLEEAGKPTLPLPDEGDGIGA